MFNTFAEMHRWLTLRGEDIARFESHGTSVAVWPKSGVSFVDLKYGS
jgi:hypothetical protein